MQTRAHPYCLTSHYKKSWYIFPLGKARKLKLQWSELSHTIEIVLAPLTSYCLFLDGMLIS